MYHGLHQGKYSGDPSLAKYSVYLPRFGEQLNQIRKGEYTVASVPKLWTDPQDDVKNGRFVGITFDDGQASDYEIGVPALLRYGFRADFFINTSKIGERGFLTWQQIVEMHSVGMGIHSHSHDHVVLSRLATPALKNQLRRSKELLESHISAAVEFLAVPYGFVNRRVVTIAQEVGYKAVCHSLNWPAHPKARLIPRVAVYGETSLQEFKQLLHRQLPAYVRRAIRGGLRYLPKQLLLRYSPNRLGVRVLESRA
jgi:peptidoglycan/xylan/chitin deacetylase (PgdA/CDA1 family)